jgi:hypothetical protein
MSHNLQASSYPLLILCQWMTSAGKMTEPRHFYPFALPKKK